MPLNANNEEEVRRGKEKNVTARHFHGQAVFAAPPHQRVGAGCKIFFKNGLPGRACQLQRTAKNCLPGQILHAASSSSMSVWELMSLENVRLHSSKSIV